MKIHDMAKARTDKTDNTPLKQLRDQIGLYLPDELAARGLRDLTRHYSIDAEVRKIALRHGWTPKEAIHFSRVAIEKAVITAYDAAELGLWPKYLNEWKGAVAKSADALSAITTLVNFLAGDAGKTRGKATDKEKAETMTAALVAPLFQVSALDFPSPTCRAELARTSAATLVEAQTVVRRIAGLAECNGPAAIRQHSRPAG